MHNINNRFEFSFLLLALLVVSLPLLICKYFASYSALPKSSLLVILGGLFALSVIVSYLIYFRGSYNELIVSLKTPDIAILLFLISLFLSTIFSLTPEVSYHGSYQRQTGLRIYLYCILIYFLISAVLSRERILKLIYLMEITAVAVSLYTIMQTFSADPFSIQPANQIRPVSTLGSPVYVAGFLVTVLPFSVINISGKRNAIIKYLYPTLITAGILLSGTRSAYIAVAMQFVCGFVLVLVNRQWFAVKPKSILTAVIILSVMIAVILSLSGGFYAGRIYSLLNFTDNPRFLLWRDSFSIFLKYPLTGCGLDVFSKALEEFYSFELRVAESTRYFDHPHNNFLYYLYSSGILGFVAYCWLLIYVLRSCIIKFIQGINSSFHYAMTLFVTGYAIYGLADFDDVTIILYIFVLFGMFRYMHDKTLFSLRGGLILKILFVFVSVMYVINLYMVYNELKADRYYKLALSEMKENNIKNTVNNLNAAVEQNPRNSVYRFELASYSYLIASTIYGEHRSYLLEQVKAEIERARSNYISNLECDEILSMVYYEEGNYILADSMKKNILAADPVNINYRIHLARFYLRSYNFSEVEKQLQMIFTYSPENIEAAYIAVGYYDFVKDEVNLRYYCNIILKKNPDDLYVREILKKYPTDNNRR